MLNRYNTSTATLEQDVLLKQVIETRVSKGEKRFDWENAISAEQSTSQDIVVANSNGEMAFDLKAVAATIGEALTDLLIAKGDEAHDQIFNEENRGFVAETAQAVSNSLMSQVEGGGQLRLSRQDLYLLIEKALIEKNRHDVAKSLTLFRQFENSGDFSQDEQPVGVKLIRRNNSVVPWNEAKIATAIRRAFLTMEEDPEPGGQIARAVTNRVTTLGSSQIDIEEVQDIVQEELMRHGYFRVAEHYILYRAQRARLRAESMETQDLTDDQQESMVVVIEEDGTSNFWDGQDLRKRIEFASAGLELNLSEVEIEAELRRSLTAEITKKDLRKLVILNSKTLLEQDADFARFSGRILLTYIYEEVLNWDIVRDGREGLKKAHQKGFVNYIKYGVEINRLSPDLLSYDLKAISESLDPSADLDFEFLGVSTLYDRYLIIDKTKTQHRRMETPQFFWMRVALGLFKAEEDGREEKAKNLYKLYKSRRFCSSTPTLFNSGTMHSQLSSCYLYKVDDSIESIMQRGIGWLRWILDCCSRNGCLY